MHLELSRGMQRPGMGGWVYQIFLEVHSCQPSLGLPIAESVMSLSFGIVAEAWLSPEKELERIT